MTEFVWLMVIVSVFFSLLYGLKFTHQRTSVQKTLVKTVPVLALALISFSINAPMILTLALLFGAAGDACLSRDGEAFFLAGLSSFLLGHLGFCLLFFQTGDGLPLIVPDWARLIAALLLTIRYFLA